jgi:Domain of unknown function (DUF397)
MTIEAVPCAHRGSVDLVDSRYPDGERLHFSPAEWAEFVATMKAGKFDGIGASPPPGAPGQD